jgi:hypothetical protein
VGDPLIGEGSIFPMVSTPISANAGSISATPDQQRPDAADGGTT